MLRVDGRVVNLLDNLVVNVVFSVEILKEPVFNAFSLIFSNLVFFTNDDARLGGCNKDPSCTFSDFSFRSNFRLLPVSENDFVGNAVSCSIRFSNLEFFMIVSNDILELNYSQVKDKQK